MILYIVIEIALIALLILTLLNKFTPASYNDTQKNYFKKAALICLGVFILAFFFFIIGEAVEDLYPTFDIVGLVLIVLSFVFYFYQKYNFKKINKEN